MKARTPDERTPGRAPDLPQYPATVPRLPVANAVAAVVIAVAGLLGALAVLLLMPGHLEALGTSVTLAASGFTLAARIAVPRSS
ncbi:hypothetical protein GCM10019016_013220 [Streptomyces prasinosporus]|uniref:Uncharacterized protein n=1 Tax=Streptomyces prasinosporus TaxID=68256 RepID=A0ABP6TG72_9ACTN|nr:hypothetical protein GCM10010332_72310 [Streptomyces albogriseolus]